MDKHLSPAQAFEYLGVTRFIFNRNIRPQLTEIRHGERTVVFPKVELDNYLAESAGMFKKKTVSDALAHAWEARWKDAKGSFKKESLKDKVEAEIGHVPLHQIDYNRIDQWVSELRDRDLATATIKSRISCLSTALNLAALKDWMKAVPPMPKLGTPNRKIRYLLDDPDEEAMLLTACGCLSYKACDVMRLAIIFMLDTGCRLSELLRVRWGDIRETKQGFQVTFSERKRGGAHSVPLTEEAQSAIETLLDNSYWLARVRAADKSETRCRSAQNWMTHRFTKVRDHAKLFDVSLHTLRHTCASRLVQDGVPLYEVSQVLGHSSIQVTERYAHLAPKNLHNAMAALSNRRLPNKVTKLRRPSH